METDNRRRLIGKRPINMIIKEFFIVSLDNRGGREEERGEEHSNGIKAQLIESQAIGNEKCTRPSEIQLSTFTLLNFVSTKIRLQ